MTPRDSKEESALLGFIPSSEGMLELLRNDPLWGTAYAPGASRHEHPVGLAAIAEGGAPESIGYPAPRRSPPY